MGRLRMDDSFSLPIMYFSLVILGPDSQKQLFKNAVGHLHNERVVLLDLDAAFLALTSILQHCNTIRIKTIIRFL